MVPSHPSDVGHSQKGSSSGSQCCPVWDPFKIEDITEIESIQRNFTRKISGLSHLNYWERLQKLNLMSLQRRRERYIIIHTWKIANGAAPNDINMTFKNNQRLGLKVIPPKLNHKAQTSISSHYHNSFAVRAARLWNLLPKCVNERLTLESLKTGLGEFLRSYPDTPPTKGHTAVNSNSLVDWNLQRSSGRQGLEDSHGDVVHL